MTLLAFDREGRRRAVVTVRHELSVGQVAGILAADVDPGDGPLSADQAEAVVRAALVRDGMAAGLDFSSEPVVVLAERARWAVAQVRSVWPALDGDELADWLAYITAAADDADARARRGGREVGR